VLAIVVSVGILMGFPELFEKVRLAPPVTPAVPAQTETAAPAPGTTQPGATAPAAPGTAGTAASSAAAPGPETREAALAEQPRVRIDTPRLHGSGSPTGGSTGRGNPV